DDARFVEADRELARHFAELVVAETDVDKRRSMAECSICLTPVADTGEVVRFFAEDDMWTPESAVRLLELRKFVGAVPELERLAREGVPNGSSSAIRHLVNCSDTASQESVGRLRREL